MPQHSSPFRLVQSNGLHLQVCVSENYWTVMIQQRQFGLLKPSTMNKSGTACQDEGCGQ